MTIIDQQAKEHEVKKAKEQYIREEAEKFENAVKRLAATADGESMLRFFSGVMDGRTAKYDLATDEMSIVKRIYFSMGMRDLYLYLLSHLVDEGGNLVFNNDVTYFSPLSNLMAANVDKEKKAVARAFLSPEGQYILSTLRRAHYDISPALKDDIEALRFMGRHYFIFLILQCISDYRKAEQGGESE